MRCQPSCSSSAVTQQTLHSAFNPTAATEPVVRSKGNKNQWPLSGPCDFPSRFHCSRGNGVTVPNELIIEFPPKRVDIARFNRTQARIINEVMSYYDVWIHSSIHCSSLSAYLNAVGRNESGNLPFLGRKSESETGSTSLWTSIPPSRVIPPLRTLLPPRENSERS